MVSGKLRVTVCEELNWIVPNFSRWSNNLNDKRQSGEFKLNFGDFSGKHLTFSVSIKKSPYGSNPGKESLLIFIGGDTVAKQSNCKLDFEILTPAEHQRLVMTNSGHLAEDASPHPGYFNFLGHRTIQRNIATPLIDDTLVVRVKATMSNDIDNHRQTPEAQKLRNEMRDILNLGKYTDFKIVCLDKVFSCHKMFLAQKSKVFERMFETAESVEFREGRVVIEDCHPDDVQTMLEFIYAGDLRDDLEFCSEGVLKIGDKYDVSGLVEKCEEVRTNFLTIENAVDNLFVADLYNLTEMKKKVLRFTCDCLELVKKTEDWKKLEEECPWMVEQIEIFKNKKY